MRVEHEVPPPWGVVVCGIVGGCQHFIEMCCPHPHTVDELAVFSCDDEDNTFLKHSVTEVLEFH